jgi:hypothetical protein
MGAGCIADRLFGVQVGEPAADLLVVGAEGVQPFEHAACPHVVRVDPDDAVLGSELVGGDPEQEHRLARVVLSAEDVALAPVEQTTDLGRLRRLGAELDQIARVPAVLGAGRSHSRAARAEPLADPLVQLRVEASVPRIVHERAPECSLHAAESRIDDEPGVVGGVRRGRHEGGELDQPCAAAGGGQLAPGAQLPLDREHVGRLAPLGDRERRLVDERVAVAVEVARCESGCQDGSDDGRARLGPVGASQHERPEHRLLGGEVLRRDRLSAHRSRSRSSSAARRRSIAAATWRIVSRLQTSNTTRSSSS